MSTFTPHKKKESFRQLEDGWNDRPTSRRICLSNISNEAKFEIRKRDLPPAPKRKKFETAQLEHLQRKWDRPLKLTHLGCMLQ